MSQPLRQVLPGVLIVLACVAAVALGRQGRERSMSDAGLQARMKGAADAPVLLVEYSDFQCPNCAAASPMLAELVKKFEGKVRLVFRHYPLEGHRWARPAAVSAECAAKQGKFWAYHDLLFQEQAVWAQAQDPRELFAGYAQKAGLDIDAYVACYNGTDAAEAVERDLKEAAAWQVDATPTLFVGRKRLVGARQIYHGSVNAVERALKQ